MTKEEFANKCNELIGLNVYVIGGKGIDKVYKSDIVNICLDESGEHPTIKIKVRNYSDHIPFSNLIITKEELKNHLHKCAEYEGIEMNKRVNKIIDNF